uniref:phosphatidylinositol 3-kinase catalytic subunit type 3-like isoform X1 n=1 Tax=Styela clava TaxID=7725 RepID=UPI00193ACDB1|nr:phosphatidylinositol 3-kinase catalytic subunit type 3-like isoform X1 [Styela clava]
MAETLASTQANLRQAPEPIPTRFNYIYSSDLNVNVYLKICSLEGSRPVRNYKEFLEDPMLGMGGLNLGEDEDDGSHMYVTVQIFSEDKPICLPVQTKYKYVNNKARHTWNEWLKLPLRYTDLPRNAMLAITVFDVHGPNKATPVGGTTVNLFGKYGTLRQGMTDFCVWPDVEASGKEATETPHKAPAQEGQQMARLSKLVKQHREGHMTKVDWLDRLVFREIEVINKKEKKDVNFMYLNVEFPRFAYNDIDYSVTYFEDDGDDVLQVRTSPQLVVVPDHELTDTNLVEEKHRKLARSLHASQHDLKPNASTRDQLAAIVQYPPSKQLTSEEEDLIWKFRHYLTNQKKALTKFLKCVKWERPAESNIAIQLLEQWQPIDVIDALELVSPNFKNPTVRSYAVKRLAEAQDEDLLLYLLQLVQALKYENFENIKAGLTAMKRQEHPVPAVASTPPLVSKSVGLQTSSMDGSTSEPSNDVKVPEKLQEDIPGDGSMALLASQSQPDLLMQSGIAMSTRSPKTNDGQQAAPSLDLATFLIERACKNSTLANYFYWYLLVECEEQESSDHEKRRDADMYITVMKRFSYALLKGDRQCRIRRSQLAGQQKFVNKIVWLMKTLQKDSSNRKRKIEKLRAMLADPDSSSYNFSNFDPLPLPLDPEVKVNGILADKASLYKSALMPAKLTFRVADGKSTYTTLFKHGDDLRQDQLILQIITLMDSLLQKENLDLKLTPYKVLATSTKHGFVHCIESKSVAEVLATEGSIQNYFRKLSPSESRPYGIEQDVMDNYVKSCAGYCVITYLLGVGDRHLDNLLLTKSGSLFHVDFGYILGRDPKPLPPPMKLSKEMVEGMGGLNSEHYQEFRKYCYTTFLHLRRHANLILNLFSLMTDASVPDIALEPDKTVKKVQDKFCLDLTDEEAVRHMQGLIDESVNALFAAVVEQIHKVAQYWRR